MRPECRAPNILAPVVRWCADERGQDLVEYTLLLVGLALAGAAAFIGMGASTAGIWTTVNSRLPSAGGARGGRTMNKRFLSVFAVAVLVSGIASVALFRMITARFALGSTPPTT